MKLLLRWIFNAGAMLLIARFIDGIELSGFYAALITVLILGLVNALIKPILLLLTLPVNILTLGLLTFVINAGLFWLTGTIVEGFSVAWFWPVVIGAILMSISSWIIVSFLYSEK